MLVSVEVPPPEHDSCCVMAISASHRAIARTWERGEGLSPGRHERTEPKLYAWLERAGIESSLRKLIRNSLVNLCEGTAGNYHACVANVNARSTGGGLPCGPAVMSELHGCAAALCSVAGRLWR